jgi:hypothetical protein
MVVVVVLLVLLMSTSLLWWFGWRLPPHKTAAVGLDGQT